MPSIEFATGAVAMALSLGSYALKSHRALTLTAAVAVLFWSAHFWAKDAMTSSVLALVMALRIVASLYTVHRPAAERRWWTLGGLLVASAGSYFTWAGWVSVPSTLASLWLTFIGLNWKDVPLRLGFLLAETLWLINAIAVGSWFAGLTACAALTVNTLALVKYHPEILKKRFSLRRASSV